MANRINSHVERLHQYLPFDPSHDQIYEEYAETKDSLEMETKALDYLRKTLNTKPPVAVILTGDAGHGKTHLCRRLIEDYLKYSKEEARKLLVEKCNGEDVIPHCSSKNIKPLRIFKDLSEFSIEIATEKIRSSLSDNSDITLLCVNEGRLRAILESGIKEYYSDFYNEFHNSFTNGFATTDGKWLIINLNYQSISSDKIEDNLINEALRKWLSGNRWRICKECDCYTVCPVVRNREMLSDELFDRISRILCIFSVAERLGTVITLREMLMTVAYLITGGLRCSDVHKKRNKTGWQNEYAYYSLLFIPPRNISKDKIARIPVLNAISSLDPGKNALREIDDRLINHTCIFPENEIDLSFSDIIGGYSCKIDAANGIDEIIGNARSKNERDKEAGLVEKIVQALRRRSFFDDRERDVSLTKRLGFEYADDFLWIISGESNNQRKAKIKRQLIAGLHTVQGLNLGQNETSLFLVDPAFGNVTNRAAIIAHKVPGTDISIVNQSQNWKNSEDNTNMIYQTVNWLERVIVLQIEITKGEKCCYYLDLMGFDYLMRAGLGYISHSFYAHDIRKVINFLGRLAECGNLSSSGIEAIIEGKTYTVSVEEGNVIQASGGSL